MIDIEKNKSQRQAYLEEVYRQTDGQYMTITKIDKVAKVLKIDRELSASISQHLAKLGLIKFVAIGGFITINPKGIQHIEDSKEENSATHPNIYSAENITLVNEMHHSQIQQGTTNSRQTLGHQSSLDMAKLLGTLIEEIKRESTQNQSDKEAAQANAEILKLQLSIPEEHRDKSSLQRAWDYLSATSSLISVSKFVTEHSDKILPLIGL